MSPVYLVQKWVINHEFESLDFDVTANVTQRLLMLYNKFLEGPELPHDLN